MRVKSRRVKNYKLLNKGYFYVINIFVNYCIGDILNGMSAFVSQLAIPFMISDPDYLTTNKNILYLHNSSIIIWQQSNHFKLIITFEAPLIPKFLCMVKCFMLPNDYC